MTVGFYHKCRPCDAVFECDPGCEHGWALLVEWCPACRPTGASKRILAERERPPTRCGRCGGPCPPRADGYCATLGFPATRNYGG